MKKQTNQRSPEQRVLQFTSQNELFTGRQPLLVAVSGGPDSVCLLHILAHLQDELGVSLHIAHLDHQLRGAESEADAAYVSELARQFGLPVTTGACDAKAYRAERRLSLEEAAREARYNFLAEVAEAIGADRVAVGHTSDDHIETILMHLIRGTGTRGLRGLQPTSQWRSPGHSLTVVRPLLPLSRQETTEYCRMHNLQPRQDSSNQSLSPLRNRIRHQLVPLLESYNPNVKEVLARTARLTEDDLALLNQESARLGAGIIQKENRAFIFDKDKFVALPVGLKRHLLREAIAELLGDLKDIEARHINGIIEAAGKQAGKRIRLPGGLAFVMEYGRFLLAPETLAASPLPNIEGQCLLNIPGETVFSGWRITAAIIQPEEMKDTEVNIVAQASPPVRPIVPPGHMERAEGELSAYLDLEETGETLIVRSRRPGDTFQPLGMNQTKELAEFMIDAKIPRAWRAHVPIVCSTKHIVWVVGWRLDERAKVTPESARVLRLTFERS